MTYYYYGSYGNDYFNYNGNDNLVAYGSSGYDTIYGNYYADYINGESGNDWLNGYTGSDTLVGGTGSDVLIGYGGTVGEYDVLWGDTGYDYGDLGYDTFILGDSSWGAYYQGTGHATIMDWNSYYDTIQLSGYGSQYSLVYENWSGTSSLDTAIYYGNDLIGVVQDTTAVYTNDFQFV